MCCSLIITNLFVWSIYTWVFLNWCPLLINCWSKNEYFWSHSFALLLQESVSAPASCVEKQPFLVTWHGWLKTRPWSLIVDNIILFRWQVSDLYFFILKLIICHVILITREIILRASCRQMCLSRQAGFAYFSTFSNMYDSSTLVCRDLSMLCVLLLFFWFFNDRYAWQYFPVI